MDHEQLSIHFGNLAVLDETDSPVISCYVNHESGRPGYRDVIDARVRQIRGALSADQRLDFEHALAKIEAFLAAELSAETKGAAVFSRAGGAPFFQALQFRVPLPNLMSVDSVPHIYELVSLKDTYHRYVVLIATASHARIVEVSVGNVTRELWTERPELRQRVGREWTKERYQNHRSDRTHKFLKEKIALLDRLFAEEAHTHLVLAGNPRIVARVRDNLPRRLLDRLVDVVPVSGNAPTSDVVNATLSAFAEHEASESVETAGLFLDELRRGGLAVAGTEATLQALARGQVDIIVLSESYVAPSGWKCRSCDAVGVDEAPTACPRCGERAVAPLNLKEHMTSTAERLGSTVEILRNSDLMLEVGGVGCLLRYLMPEQYAQAYGRRAPNESSRASAPWATSG